MESRQTERLAEADRLSRALERLVRSLRASAIGEPLTPAAASVLTRLEEEGPSSITGLARGERVSQPAMTQLIDRLSSEDLVERRVPEEDRRSVRVSLTEAGLAALQARRTWRAVRLDERLAALAETDQDAIAGALPALERLASTAVMADSTRH